MMHLANRPTWARPFQLESNLTDAELAIVDQRQVELLQVVQNALTEYVNDDSVCFTDGVDFPNRDKITGEYYLQNEVYQSQSGGIEIRLTVHCVEKLDQFSERTDDYLGFFVGLTLDLITSELSLHTLDSIAL